MVEVSDSRDAIIADGLILHHTGVIYVLHLRGTAPGNRPEMSPIVQDNCRMLRPRQVAVTNFECRSFD